MEVIPLRNMRLRYLHGRVRHILRHYQVLMKRWDRFYVVEMVPENGSLLLGWWEVPHSKREKCKELVLSKMSSAETTKK